MARSTDLKLVRVSIMNAVHDLAVLVARDEGLFNDEGLEVEVIGTPGTAQANAGRQALRDVIFDRTMESLYNTGDVDQYRMCEWGVMKRTVEAVSCGQRPARIVALGAAMSKMAIITAPNSRIYEPEQLKDTPVAVSPFNGSHFTTLKMLDHSTRSEAASDDLDGPTLAAMFRAEAKAAELINANPARYAHYLVAEAQGLLAAHELQTWRLLYGPPMPYTRERYTATYEWMLSYPGLITPGAAYETAVDNRAWV